MTRLENKIEANDRTVYQVLNNNKYTVDYFQREFSWQKKHIEQLITDLTSSFMSEYEANHEPEEVENYNSYYLGPFVLSVNSGNRSIIDGQQRLTSLTLLMIYLHHLQKEYNLGESVDSMIFSEKFKNKSFNIVVDEFIPCLQSLFENGYYDVKDSDDESTQNLVARYEDIVNSFPKEIDKVVLPYYIDWMKERVILVEIIAYSDDNAYTIFETMNDRGLNLSPTEMLKGFILSRFIDSDERQRMNDLWKESIQKLHCFDKDEDQQFFQAFLRGQYAQSIREGKVGSTNQDFEKIGTRFHDWVRKNLDLMRLSADSQKDNLAFMNQDFTFFLKTYLTIKKAEIECTPLLEHIYYIERWGIASSLSYPLLLASLEITDIDETVRQKMNSVAKYIETYCVRRSVNYKTFSSSSIRYTMYMLVKEIRKKPLSELTSILSQKINNMEQGWDGIDTFSLHGQNKRFIKFLLSRISEFVDHESGVESSFQSYYEKTVRKKSKSKLRKPFEVEHIWANKFSKHKDEFSQQNDFDEYRNRLGGLVLLPRGTNQSYGDKSYLKKVKHYVKENLLVKSLCELTYENNPNFLNMIEKYDFPFEHHKEFLKADIEKRQKLYRKICETIWSFEGGTVEIGQGSDQTKPKQTRIK